MASFTVVYDACVLYPFTLRDLLIRLARTGLFRAKWTDQILDECFVSILEARTDLDPRALERTRKLMIAAVPDCLVRGCETLIDGLRLPDPADRHVLAAAIRSGAQVIVPDSFVLHLLDLSPAAVVRVVTEQADALKNPKRTVEDVLDRLETLGLPQSVAEIRSRLG